MPLPLIYAAGAVVARYIAKRGLQAAAKKFTTKAISEGKKHAADLLKKNGGQTAQKAANIKNIKPVQALNANSRSTLRKGLGVGAAAGAVGGVVAMKNKVKDMRQQLKLAKTEAKRAQMQTAIEKTLAKIAVAEQKAKPTAQAPKKSMRPKARP